MVSGLASILILGGLAAAPTAAPLCPAGEDAVAGLRAVPSRVGLRPPGMTAQGAGWAAVLGAVKATRWRGRGEAAALTAPARDG